MNIPPINHFAGMAVQSPDDRKAIQQDREHEKTQSQMTKKAAGDGEATALESATDRDADGQQNWQRQDSVPQVSREPEVAASIPPQHSRDPYNQRGNHLDLEG
jgi:hypothetical protein